MFPLYEGFGYRGSEYPYAYGPYGGYSRYGTLELTESSPSQGPFVEPLSMWQVQDYLGLPIISPSMNMQQDLQILQWITAAREIAEIYQKRDLVRKQFDLSMDYWLGYRIELRYPLVSVDLFQYTDDNNVVTPMVEGTDYIVDLKKKPGLVVPPYNVVWPSYTPLPSSSILLRFSSGYLPTSVFWNDAGARIKNGMLLLISQWFNNRLPFDKGVISELPFAITDCFSLGATITVR